MIAPAALAVIMGMAVFMIVIVLRGMTGFVFFHVHSWLITFAAAQAAP